jgi:hypothetical protein
MLHESAGKKKIRGILPSIQRLLRMDRGFGLDKLGAHSLTAEVMGHPLIVGMAQQGRMPSYIPSAIFARAFISTLTARYGKAQTAAMLLSKVGNDGLSRTLLAIMGEGPDNVAALEAAVRIWYDTVMERTSGWYKRRSQLVLFCVGLFYACAMNIDALGLSQRLWNDAAATAELVRKAAEAKPPAVPPGATLSPTAATPPAMPPGATLPPSAATPPAATPTPPSGATLTPLTPTAQAAQAGREFQAVKALPIGWPSSRFDAAAGQGAGAFMIALAFALLGWVVTAFASSLGAPFWFDGIGWLLALRGSGAKPPDTIPSVAPLVLPGTPT